MFFVELYRKYLFLGPPGSHSWLKLHVQTDAKWQPESDYWYTNCPVGKNTLAKYIQNMMAEAGIEGHFHNHSTRKSTCTHLFQKGVDPQLIKEQTGHKSKAIMRYKKSNIAMKKQVSDMLSVLLQEMNQIRDREAQMLEVECKSEEEEKKIPEVERESVVVDAKKGLDVHVSMAPGLDFSKLQGLINIHVHLHQK